MATTGTLFEAMVSYYGNLSRQALSALYQTREDLRAGNFEWNKALGRTISFWMDATDGWWNAFLVSASAPLPTIFLDVHADDSTAVRSVNVAVPGGGDVDVSVIGQIGGTKHIPKKFLDIEPTAKRDAIEVKLKNIKALRRGPDKVPDGLYGGIIHIKERPLAFLMIRLE